MSGDEFDVHPSIAVADEISHAVADLKRPPEDYHRLPWSALDQAVGGMPGGEVCYVAAFSSSGKTTFLSSLTDEYFEKSDKAVYYMGLESRPKTLRTHWACKRLGFDAGDILSGEFLKWTNFKQVRERLQEELHSQNTGDKFERVRFCPTPYVDAQKIKRAAKAAQEFGADVFIIDHVDHIDGSPGRGSAWDKSVEVNQSILHMAQEYGFLMMPATQLNNDAVRGNRLALYLPPQPQHVKMGSHKREVATWMLGLYRPLKIAGSTPEELRAVNAGAVPTNVLEPNTMAVVQMKNRFYGNREWTRTFLRVERGRVLDADQQLYTERTTDKDGFRVSP